MIIKHLYQRTITSKGKKIKAWYYWYYDNSGKQIRKSCGVHGPCLTKREAEIFIANLNDDELIQKDKITFNQFCKDIYKKGSPFLNKLETKGKILSEDSIYQKNHYLKILLDKFGEMEVDKVDGNDFDNFISGLPYCSSVKNHLLTIVNEIETELYSYHLIKSIPYIQRYKRHDTKEKGILTVAEIKRLFPDDINKMVEIWKLSGSANTYYDDLIFAIMIFTILSTGMRSSEVRALQWNQFIKDDVIIINAMIDSQDKRVDHLKKGDKENKKWRLVVLPSKTAELILYLKKLQLSNEFVFERKNNPVTTFHLLNHFKAVLKQNGIDCDKRNITIHSLRFTYNTIMRREISDKDLQLMLGHVSGRMTDYYDVSKVLDNLPGLIQNKDRINSVWN